MISDCTKSIIKYGRLKGIGKKYLNDVLISCAQEGISVEDYLYERVIKNNKYEKEEILNAERYAEAQVANARSLGHTIISRNDDTYPDSLRAVFDPPPLLYCSGNLSLLKKESVTVIGTREPTEHGRLIAERVTSWFVEDGWVITSGLAKGVDTVAHRVCVDAGGATIAVMAQGLEKVYPAANKELASEIVKSGGLLVSEYGYNSFVGKSNFVERDRIQASLAKGVVLVQSDLGGGSLHASRAALRYGRYLLVLGQSSRDVMNREPKISANLLLAYTDENAKLELLKVSAEDLKKSIFISDKSVLPEVSKKLKALQFAGKDNGSDDLFR